MTDCQISKCPLVACPCPLIAERASKCPNIKPQPCYGTFTDPRDGRAYRTVKIGDQVWMAENLAFDYAGSKVYGNDLGNLAKYGRLYTWEQAKRACPPGWHLPSNKEWDKLMRYADGTSGTESPYDSPTAGKYLKAKEGWNAHEIYGKGTDDFGFSALPGGFGSSDGYFYRVGGSGYWWSSNEDYSNYAYSRYMLYSIEYARWSSDSKDYLFSVRCLQDGSKSQ
jgi:uncharacterized protein (TIGR02145 family)